MDLFSTVCAVQNLWLAARAEGVAVGWVSIIKKQDLTQILKLPSQVVPVAYLCIGHTQNFAPEPELKTLGWQEQVPFESIVFSEEWGIKPA
jgi:5,6-dimethylbenzimidazole synthase